MRLLQLPWLAYKTRVLGIFYSRAYDPGFEVTAAVLGREYALAGEMERWTTKSTGHHFASSLFILATRFLGFVASEPIRNAAGYPAVVMLMLLARSFGYEPSFGNTTETSHSRRRPVIPSLQQQRPHSTRCFSAHCECVRLLAGGRWTFASHRQTFNFFFFFVSWHYYIKHAWSEPDGGRSIKTTHTVKQGYRKKRQTELSVSPLSSAVLVRFCLPR